MNEEQISTRKNWLRTLLVLMAMNFLFSAFFMPKDPAFILMPPAMKLITRLFSLLVPLAFNYLVYHCAYKKAGTKMLTFLIFFTPIAFALSIASYWFGIARLPRGFWLWAYVVMSQGVAVWWYLLHWKMRAINRARQAGIAVDA